MAEAARVRVLPTGRAHLGDAGDPAPPRCGGVGPRDASARARGPGRARGRHHPGRRVRSVHEPGPPHLEHLLRLQAPGAPVRADREHAAGEPGPRRPRRGGRVGGRSRVTAPRPAPRAAPGPEPSLGPDGSRVHADPEPSHRDPAGPREQPRRGRPEAAGDRPARRDHLGRAGDSHDGIRGEPRGPDDRAGGDPCGPCGPTSPAPWSPRPPCCSSTRATASRATSRRCAPTSCSGSTC